MPDISTTGGKHLFFRIDKIRKHKSFNIGCMSFRKLVIACCKALHNNCITTVSFAQIKLISFNIGIVLRRTSSIGSSTPPPSVLISAFFIFLVVFNDENSVEIIFKRKTTRTLE